MAKPKLKREAILGQMLLGYDSLAEPIDGTVPLSSAYTRTHQVGGLVIGGRSDRNFYHPIPRQGVTFDVPGLTVYRWTNFSTFSGNANSTLSNGLTVDGLINPSMPSGGGTMKFTLSTVHWSDLGLPAGVLPRFVTVTIKSRLMVELPQFIGYEAGFSHEGGYIDDIFTNIHSVSGDNLVSAGSIGVNTPNWPYRIGYQLNKTSYDFQSVLAPFTFDIEVWIHWNRPNGRWNMQAMEFKMEW